MKRVFISFAIEDKHFRDLLVGQSRNERTPFEFVDMSVQEPWETDWESKCRARINTCNGMIALVSANTARASGAHFEIKCALDSRMPLMPMYVDDSRGFLLPPELSRKQISVWSWENLKNFVSRL